MIFKRADTFTFTSKRRGTSERRFKGKIFQEEKKLDVRHFPKITRVRDRTGVHALIKISTTLILFPLPLLPPPPITRGAIAYNRYNRSTNLSGSCHQGEGAPDNVEHVERPDSISWKCNTQQDAPRPRGAPCPSRFQPCLLSRSGKSWNFGEPLF